MSKLPAVATAALFAPDKEQAKRFLLALDGTATDFLFVAVHKDQHQVPKITRQPPTDQVLSSLVEWNKNGWNIFVTVNATRQGISRTKDDITRIRTIFIDDDGKKEVKPYPLPPSYIVETSPGKRQVYWFLKAGGIPVDEWDQIQQTLVNDYGGDPNARDVARILRLPGLYNVKEEYRTKPRCNTIEGNALYYDWEMIKQHFPLTPVVTSTGRIQGEALDIKATIEQFISGKNYHQAGIALAGWFFNKGVTTCSDLTLILQGLMDTLGDVADPRFNHRREKDIPTSVAWIIKERKKEKSAPVLSIFEKPVGDQYTTLPRPGGGLHKVAAWVESIMRYPNKTIASIVAEHLVSVFGGGHYHLLGNTTTRKRIMLAPLGAGKNTITRALGKVVQGLSAVNGDGMPWVLEASKFIGSDSFSFSVQHKQIEEHRVRSFLVNEAGESGKSKAGDIDNLRAYQLQALSTKADEVFMPKKFSEQGKNDSDKQMQEVYGGVWVYMHESTVRSYSALLSSSDAFVNGDLSRSDIFFINPTITKINRAAAAKYMPEEILRLFSGLANDLRSLPGGKGSEEHRVWEEINLEEIQDELDRLEQDIVVKRNRAYGSNDDVKVALLGRRYERILTSILICALADAAISSPMQKPKAIRQHLEYALKRADAIDKTILYHSATGGDLSTNQYEKVEEQFKDKFSKLVSDRLKTMRLMKHEVAKCGPTKGRDGWIMTYTAFTRQMQRGAYQNLVKEVYRGDSSRARSSFIAHLEALEMLIPVVIPTAEKGSFKRVPNRWWLNPDFFPVEKTSKK